tara:strand:+ start:785 stop:889 length:105 start_codon:yes stop_codon:yes gene_type:complete
VVQGQVTVRVVALVVVEVVLKVVVVAGLALVQKI